MRRILLSLPFLLLLPLAIPLVVPATTNAQGLEEPTVSPRCEARMDRTAGRYARCLLKAKSRAARDQEQDVEETREAEAECREDFDDAVGGTLDRHQEENCTPLISQMEARTASCAESLAMEARGTAVATLLYVQDAQAATLDDSLLVLADVDDQTLWFTGRPYRETGQMTTADFVALFSEEGPNSFAADPPNADLSCEVDGEVVNHVVTLRNPVRIQVGEGTWDLQYTARPTGEGPAAPSVSCDGDAHLFIDSTTKGTSCHPTPSYNCFVGGFCSQAAISFPPATNGYTNVYDGHTQGTDPALGAGCSTFPGSVSWLDGSSNILNSVSLHQGLIVELCISN